MGKEKFDVSNIVGQKVTTTEELGNGFVRIGFNDGTMIVAQVVPLGIKAVTEKAAPVKEDKKAPAKGKGKKDEPEEEEEEEDDDEGEEISIDEMREALIEAGEDKKKVKKMSDEEVEDAYDELEEEEEDDDEGEEEESDDLTADDINDADFDDLEDIIDDKELDIDIEDYDAKSKGDKDLIKLRKDVAKALKIKL